MITAPVSTETTDTVGACIGTSCFAPEQSAQITVRPFHPTLTIEPAEIVGDPAHQVKVTLTLDAPSNGVSGRVDSDSAGVVVPPQQECQPLFYVLAGQNSTEFYLPTAQVTQPTLTALTVTSSCYRPGAITASATVLVLPDAQQAFNLVIEPAQGAISSVRFTDHNVTVPQSVAKLGQSLAVRVLPINPNGTQGAAINVQQSQSNVNVNPAVDSPIFGTPTRLFQGNVFVHFPPGTGITAHQFFAVHSGTSQIDLTFIYDNNQYHVHVPLQAVACIRDYNCQPQLGTAHPEFDALIMAVADRNGIPPQLIKAQIERESGFHADAYRYEPLSYDWRMYHPDGTLAIQNRFLGPWVLAESADCQVVSQPAGNQITDLGNADVSLRQKYGVFTSRDGNPLCVVTSAPAGAAGRRIISADQLLSMENILYSNDACILGTSCADWARQNQNSFVTFTEQFQDTHGPFSAQTVVAASYGLHQLMYETAVGMGFRDRGAGKAPHLLLDPGTSLDLGSEYLARQYNGIDAQEFDTSANFFFQFGTALRNFNGPPHLTYDEIFAKCGDGNYIPAGSNATAKERAFDYPCLVLSRRGAFAPLPIQPNGAN